MSHYECKECQKPYQYCKCKQERKMNELKNTKAWFEQAIPEPTDKQKCVQIGVHIEEVAEMFDALNLLDVGESLHDWGDYFKSCNHDALGIIEKMDRVSFFDSILDQNVTGNGVCHTQGFDIIKGLAEVNRSNFSKFEDGKPVFDANGKITKGKHYTPPELGQFI